MSKSIFKKNERVYYEDTDAGGVVYHAQYLNYMERCRCDWLESLGFDVTEVAKEYGIVFLVREANVQYYRPAVLRDKLIVTCEILQLGKVRLLMKQTVYNQETLLCSAVIKLASIDQASSSLVSMPDALLKILKKQL